jgi:hypothetical protein
MSFAAATDQIGHERRDPIRQPPTPGVPVRSLEGDQDETPVSAIAGHLDLDFGRPHSFAV